MAATNFTPISLYYSTTASAAPSAGNLVAGELALNTLDEKLYFKNSAGTVKLLASVSGATGTVSSVAASVPAFLSIAGSPITTSGTLAITYSGTALPIANGGTGTTSTTFANLTTNVTGTLPVANGGTSLTTLTANNVILGNGTSAPTFVAPSTNGNVLTSNGTTWTSAAAGAALSGVTDSASPFETALGYQAGNATTGVNNTWVGYEAGLLTTSGTGNTAVGYAALDANTTGASNVALGSGALGSSSTISNTTAIGFNALNANTTGQNGTAVGYGALDANTTGGQNTAVGSDALGANTTGDSNSAFGLSALNLNTIGVSNAAVGRNTLYANTTGNYNTGVGRDALTANTTANNNTAVGHQALDSTTTGSNNTGLGSDALQANTTGIQNTVLGSNAGIALTTGSNNILIGYNAAASSASVSNENTFGNSSTTSNRFWGDMKMGGSSAGTSGQVLTSAGAGAAPTWAAAGGLTLGTPVATTSGTAIDITGIPAGTKQILIMFVGVSTSGNNQKLIQIGDSGGIEDTSYVGNAISFFSDGTFSGPASRTDGFAIRSGSSSDEIQGYITLVLENSTNNTWVIGGVMGEVVAPTITQFTVAGSKSLSGVLTQLRLTVVGGVDTFDGGEINIAYM